MADLLKSDSFGLLPLPAGRVFGSVAWLAGSAEVDSEDSE